MDPEHKIELYWRVGRKLGRTIYAIVGHEPSDDVFLGIMDDPGFAAQIVDEHNVRVQIYDTTPPERIHDGDIATTYLLNQPEIS